MVAPAPTPTRSERPQFPSPQVALGLLSESAAHRTELATVELEEVRQHVVVSATIAGLAGAFALFAGFAFTLTFASLVWDQPHRGWWLSGLALVYFVAALGAGFGLVRRLRLWRPFSETLFQLQRDHQCLRHLIKSAIR